MVFALAVFAYIILLGAVAILCERYTALVGVGGLLALLAIGRLLH